MEEELQDKIGYHLQSPAILREALQPSGTAPLQGNKRLALVGDWALALSVLDKSYQHNETISTSIAEKNTITWTSIELLHRSKRWKLTKVRLQIKSKY